MKSSFFWLTSLFLLIMTVIPQQGQTAIAKQDIHLLKSEKQAAYEKSSSGKKHSFREKLEKRIAKGKEKIGRWWRTVQMSFPSGKLLTSLVLLLVSIIFFAVAGATVIATILNLLGSIAVIGSVIFFVLWLTDRSRTSKPKTD